MHLLHEGFTSTQNATSPPSGAQPSSPDVRASYTSGMPRAPRILVIAATPHELATPTIGADASEEVSFIGTLCGVGPVEASISASIAIAEHQPDAILHVGIAGARRAAALAPATLVIGTASLYTDLTDIPAEWAPSQLHVPEPLIECIRRALPHARAMPIGTTARVGGSLLGAHATDVEAMEGFGVLRAAQRMGIPAIEVRAISNDIEEPDRARWHFRLAFDAITAATPALVQAMRAVLQQERYPS